MNYSKFPCLYFLNNDHDDHVGHVDQDLKNENDEDHDGLHDYDYHVGRYFHMD